MCSCPIGSVHYEPMFASKKTVPARAADALDLIIEFATLGEYGLEYPDGPFPEENLPARPEAESLPCGKRSHVFRSTTVPRCDGRHDRHPDARDRNAPRSGPARRDAGCSEPMDYRRVRLSFAD